MLLLSDDEAYTDNVDNEEDDGDSDREFQEDELLSMLRKQRALYERQLR